MNVLARMVPAFQQGGGDSSVVAVLPSIIVGIFMIVCLWRIFGKAGQPGWYCLIPIWNTIVMLKIAGRPWWWIILLLIPLVNIVIFVLFALSFGRSFGRSGAFSIFFLMLCSIVGMAILAFGSSRYVGPDGQPSYQGA